MGLFDHFPYTNFHELNLTWLLEKVKELENIVNNFVALNTIKYADPIQWNITTQYEANTVVVDPQSGTAYISTKAVPTGIAISNTDYWSVIFTLDIISANKNITLRDDGSNVLATFASAANDWLLWNGTLYKVTQTINVNEAYVAGYNLVRYTVELFIKDYISNIQTIIGDLDDLNTSDKTSIVNATNELVAAISNIQTNIGDLNDLTTSDNTSIVNAINELVTAIAGISYTYTYDTIAQLKAADLSSGVVRVLGYHTKDDNGGGEYYITNTGNTYDILLDNGNYAHLKNNGIVTAEQFGAIADAATDNTAFVQNADDYCADNGCILLFASPHYYYFNGTVRKSLFTSWHGTGSGTVTNYENTTHRTTLHYTGSAQFILISVSGTEYAENAGIFDLRIEGESPFNAGSVGIQFSGGTRVHRIENVLMRYFNTGIYLSGGEHHFKNVFVWYCKYCVNGSGVADSNFIECQFGSGKNADPSVSGGFGIQLMNSTNQTFIGCRFQVALGGNGAVFNNCENVKCIGCTIDANDNIGIQIVNGYSYIISACEWHNNLRSLYILASTALYNVVVSDCIFNGDDLSGDTGIEAVISGSATFDGLLIHNCAFRNITTVSTINASITNKKIRDNIGIADSV